MGVQHLITCFIHSAAKLIPQLLDSLNGNFNHVARVRTNQQLAIVSQDFFLTSGDNIIHHIPVVIGIRYHREAGIRINLSQHTLDKGDFITINCEVSCHNRMLSGNSTDTNLILGAIGIVVIIQVRQCRNGRGLIERQQPRSRATSCIFHTAHTTETKVSHCHEGVCAGRSHIVILLSDLVIFPTHSCVSAHGPHFSLEQALNPLNQPCEARMSITHLNNGNTHIHNSTFGQRTNFQRQITQLMEFNNAVTSHIIQTQVSTNVFIVIIHCPFQRGGEEAIKGIHHIKDERLNTIHNHLREILIHSLSRSHIRYQIFLIVRIHDRVTLFVTIAIQHYHSTKFHIFILLQYISNVIFLL